MRNLQEKVKKHSVTKIVLTYCEKNCSSDQEKLLKFEAEEQLKSKLEKIIGIEKHAGKVRKKINHFHMA